MDLNYRGFFTPIAQEFLEQATKESAILNLIRDTGRKGHLEPRQRTEEEMQAHEAYIEVCRAIIDLGIKRGYLMDDPYEGISEMTFEREHHEWVWDETQEEFEERVKDLPPVTFRKVVREPSDEA